MAEIHHELKMRASRDRIFQTLTDGVALERWHGAKVTGNKREWRLEYPDGTVFRGDERELPQMQYPMGHPVASAPAGGRNSRVAKRQDTPQLADATSTTT